MEILDWNEEQNATGVINSKSWRDAHDVAEVVATNRKLC